MSRLNFGAKKTSLLLGSAIVHTVGGDLMANMFKQIKKSHLWSGSGRSYSV